MNKKNIILVSKACLLLSMLGFCIPVFDEANGFAALIYFLGAGEGALYISIGIALILCFLAMAASIFAVSTKLSMMKHRYPVSFLVAPEEI